MRGSFGEYTFDSGTRELLRETEPVHVSPKAFELLQMLIEARPRALSRQEILDRIWSDTFVAEGTMSVVIADLRSVLGDDPRKPRFIRTVHRYGYSFCGEFEPLLDAAAELEPAYRLLWGAREISLTHGSNLLGRCREAVAWIEDASISRRHAMIEISGTNVSIRDLGSKNGTFVRGERLTDRHLLTDGDAITLGRVPLVLRIFQDGGPTRSVHSSSL
jgi:DNA-binding winged helix-turn-helix (wHTH) protein